MNIDNTNISSRIASSISKLNITTASKAFKEAEEAKNTPNIELQENKKSDIQLIDEGQIEEKKAKNAIDVEEIQRYANAMGENLSIDDINYGLMYGRSVIADYSA